ncbi:pilus assembly protein TadG-related protein [Paraconexibacter antarcticus]|uniref:Pilus assembly protein TadG-related protein n=1 Tax=Paraconexibacter antarcticus TaxID=2949664 RepID=A0ABY5DV56_9ACTN|nr:pilus assembly protein TadG-related protein [Paraconexibacter antarcticus]UTI65898.1 pilus assembly protein TadG-related protein [Paraconexibacter antarcticus]
MPRRLRLRGDHGVATVLMAALLVVVGVPFMIFAVDVSYWWVHKRHLQNQADAAALAAAGSFRFPACVNATITNTALEYSGLGDGSPVKYNDTNPTVPASRLHVVINQPHYYNQNTKPDNPADDPADYQGPDTSPCAKKFVDVKMTETDLPHLFKFSLFGSDPFGSVVPNINAQARVKLFNSDVGQDLSPLAVQDPTPKKVRVYLVDEATGNTLKDASNNDVSVLLSQHGSGNGYLHYDNETAPLSFTPPTPAAPATSMNLGVRVALTGSNSTACPPVDALTQCYDNVATAQGLSYIRDWVDNGSALTATQKPQSRSITTQPGTCGNGSFTTRTATCTMGLTASIKWNPDITAATAASKTIVTVVFNGQSYPMTYVAGSWTTGNNAGTWSVANVSVPAGTIGPRTLTLNWEQQTGKVVVGTQTQTCTSSGNNKCTGTFAGFQRSFWNDPTDQTSRGGPIGTFDVLNPSIQQVSDLRACTPNFSTCATKLTFAVDIKGSLTLAAATDPAISLRVQNSGGGQTQAVDCDPNRDLVDSIILGCQPKYQVNDGSPCSTVTTPYPSCVGTEQGNFSNKPAKAFNERFLCNPPGNPGNCKAGNLAGGFDGKPTTCPPAGSFGHNNWPNYPTNDPRLIGVYVTPFGTFQGNGQDLFPIVKFAQFYVTGYASNGSGFDNPCIGQGDEFAPGTESDIGVVSGHFVKPLAGGGEGATNTDCDTNDVGGCVAVLVK